jgi:hypothetical protein
MHGSGGSRGLFVHLLAGAALGAVVVLMVWIFSGGRPFGEVVGTSDVRSPTTASAKQTDVQNRAAEPTPAGARLESEPPDLGAGSKGDALQFRKDKASRPAKAKAKRAATKAKARSRARKRQVVRVVAPPSDSGEDTTPVAAVPSPAPTSTPAPVAPPPKPAKPRAPTYVAGAGEG